MVVFASNFCVFNSVKYNCKSVEYFLWIYLIQNWDLLLKNSTVIFTLHETFISNLIRSKHLLRIPCASVTQYFKLKQGTLLYFIWTEWYNILFLMTEGAKYKVEIMCVSQFNVRTSITHIIRNICLDGEAQRMFIKLN